MNILTANMFSHSPFTASIELMYRYQRYHERSMEFARRMGDLREEIMNNFDKYRNLEYYRSPYEIDIMG